MNAVESRALRALGLLLAGVAGGVDALGWIGLDHVFTAHMSGNTVGLIVNLAAGHWWEVAKRCAVILYFLFGLAVGATAATMAHRRGSRSGFVYALSLEAVILAVFVVSAEVVSRGAPVARATRWYFVLLAMPAFAMGVQSATLRRFEPAHARTTYVTGVLTRLVENLVVWAEDAWPRRRPRPEGVPTRALAKQRAAVLASLWTSYALGGISAALLERVFSLRAFLEPLALLIAAIVLDGALARAGVAAAGPEEG